jgi:hypothetical protein
MNMTVGVQMEDLLQERCYLLEPNVRSDSSTGSLVIGKLVVRNVTAAGMQKWIDSLIDVHAKLQRIEAELAA